MFWVSVKGTGYPLHSPVSPSLPLQCVTVCHHFSTGFYQLCMRRLGGTTFPFWTSLEYLALTEIVSLDRAARKSPLLYPVSLWSRVNVRLKWMYFGPFISSANKNSWGLFVMFPDCCSACSPQSFAVYHAVGPPVRGVCHVISCRVASVSSSRLSLNVWRHRFCFSASNLMIAPRPIPLVQCESVWGPLATELLNAPC